MAASASASTSRDRSSRRTAAASASRAKSAWAPRSPSSCRWRCRRPRRKFANDDDDDEDGVPRGPVMIIEDDADIRSALADVIAEDGHTTMTAANGRDALDQLKTSTVAPSVIVLDLMMPVM